LRAEIEEKKIAVEKRTVEIQKLSAELGPLRNERNRLRASCIMLFGDPAPLAHLTQHLILLEEACDGMRQILLEFAGNFPDSALSAFENQTIDGLLEWLRERRRELDNFVSARFSTVPWLVGPHGGSEITAEHMAEEMVIKLFDELVRPKFGAFLRELQRFYGLP